MILLTSTFSRAIVAVMPPNGSTSLCRPETRPALAGTLFIVVACLVVAGVMSYVTATYGQWPLIVAGIIVGLLAMSSICK